MATEDNSFRWTATVTYLTDAGPLPVVHDFDELVELDDLIERGPDFGTIIDIRIVYNYASEPRTLTVEQAEKL